jgi:uncharacterized protein HemX
MHDAVWGIVIALAVPVSALIGAALNHWQQQRKAMLEAQVESRGQDMQLTVRGIDDTAQFRQELWARCERLEEKLGQAHKELLEERHKYLTLLRDHLALQARYEEAQREIDGLKDTVGRLMQRGMQ